MYVTQKLGRYDFRVGTADVQASDIDGRRRMAIPNGGTYEIIDTLPDEPDSILVARSIDSAYLSKMNVFTGDLRTVATAPLRYARFLVDHAGALRYAIGVEENRDNVTLRREGDSWKEVHRASMGDSRHEPHG